MSKNRTTLTDLTTRMAGVGQAGWEALNPQLQQALISLAWDEALLMQQVA